MSPSASYSPVLEQTAKGGSQPDAAAAAPWVADCGDGTYRNPVLYADYCDPDVVRAGEDYWMTSSSFNHAPGLPILHSRDLVNWTLVNHALPVLHPRGHFSQPRHGQGVWAPSLRFHAGKFWLFYPDPDFGLYVITATDPRGRWSEPILVKGGKGLIDPCPLWDDDGQVYLVHGWARSRSGINNLLTLHRLSADATRVLDEGTVIIDGNKMPGWNTIEGPKLYKYRGWYWVFAPAGGVAEGYQAVFRAKNIYGPYESRIALHQGASQVNGPHQGAWVDTPAGEHWFFHFQELPAYGRVVHLQPMHWTQDGWPVMGVDEDADGKGDPVSVYTKPALPSQAVAVPFTSDGFRDPALGLQWQWQANPEAAWASVDAEAGVLTLASVPCSVDSHWTAAHLLMQKFAAPSFTATVELSFAPACDGERAGLMVFGYDYAWLGLQQHAGSSRLVLRTCRDANKEGKETTVTSVPVSSTRVVLRVRVGIGAICSFAYSSNGSAFTFVGEPFQARSSMWVGAKVGLFASASPDAQGAGNARFSAFRVEA